MAASNASIETFSLSDVFRLSENRNFWQRVPFAMASVKEGSVEIITDKSSDFVKFNMIIVTVIQQVSGQLRSVSAY